MTTSAPAPWVPSRKWIAGVVTNVLTWGVALGVARLGLHEDSLTAGVVTAAIGIAAGGIAGYVVKEIPRVEADLDPHGEHVAGKSAPRVM